MQRLILIASAVALVGCPKKPIDPPPERPRAIRAEPRRAAPKPKARRARPKKPDPNRVTVNSLKLEVTLQAERSRFMAGEPIYLTYALYNHNVSYIALQTGYDRKNRLSRPNRFRVWARKVGSASRLSGLEAGQQYKGKGFARNISPDDAHKLELFLPNWVTFTQPGKYEVFVSRRLQVEKVKPRPFKRRGVKLLRRTKPRSKPDPGVVVTRRIVVTVTTGTKAKMGRLIKELAEIVFSNDYAAKTKALKALASIPDPRIVPHFLKVIKTFSSYYKYDVPLALAQFPTDKALSGLKLCVSDSNSTLRVRCAHALARSKHNKARGLLLGMRGDTYSPVRVVVVRELAKLGCGKKYVKMLTELSKDRNSTVKAPANKALAACGKKPR